MDAAQSQQHTKIGGIRAGIRAVIAFAVLMFSAVFLTGLSASAQSFAFKQSVALAAGKDKAIASFYKERDYRPIWTSGRDGQRRKAFLEAASKAAIHGLPTGRYDAREMRRAFSKISSAKNRGLLEVETTRKFLQYARDIHSGVLEPRRLGRDEFYIFPPRQDRLELLRAFAESSPRRFLKALPPSRPEYARLLKEKARLEQVMARGGWGAKVNAKKLKPGMSGDAVVALRNRLMAMGYRRLGISPTYNDALQKAVKLFQTSHGLNADGVVGGGTLSAMNVSARFRLQQVVVGLERQRWINKPLGKRHIFVNLADYRAYVVDNGKTTFVTRVVVGKTGTRFRTPEFSDTMTHMIINPSWHVPLSIATKEYLPMLQKDPMALQARGIGMTDIDGQPVDSTRVDYSQLDAENFPFILKQNPGARNALGRVKFMFPNRFNIYLHDTPSRSLFARDQRTYSHGCVRLQKPLELAYVLLARQSSTPEQMFHRYLKSGEETQVNFKEPIPVHLVYQTAWVTPQGRANYRMDHYGRDKKVFGALQKAGVVLRVIGS